LAFLPQNLRTYLAALEERRGELRYEFVYGTDDQQRPRGIVFSVPRGLRTTPAEEIAAVPVTEGADLGAIGNNALSLLEHSEHVRDGVTAFAIASGFPQMLCEDLSLSGYLHDPGKADPRYQAYYAGGDPYGPDPTEPLSKSGQRRLPRGAWERAGLPPDWRHE